MKKIGFVDYYVSEWHANNYPEWIKEACAKLRLQYEVSYAWAERDVSPYDGRTTDEWCRSFGAERCDTIAELCEKSDVIIILAPSDPDKHFGYCSEVFKLGKRTYVDKTFAPDLKTAKEIFALAEQYGTRFFSSSALRYATELDSFKNAKVFKTTGGGSNLPEYVVHQAEMVVKVMGGADKVRATKDKDTTVFDISFADGRAAQMKYSPELSFAACSDTDEYTAMASPFFVGLIADIVRFFDSGILPFDTVETLEVMRLREGALRAAASLGEWIDLGAI